ncbi:zinc-dependent metalloprotease [Quadrisphaera sp. DSM 44207]|uniref:zinc-dependent metalloprotease n=1 Tax=Quadrisphaera sp. DSM 44207 TaxID=1881057 RepID=UPI00350F6524
MGGLGDLGALGGPGGIDPAQLFQQLSSDPAALQQVLASVQRLLSSSGEGPVNWDLARDLARQTAVAGGDPSPGEAARREVTEALRLADLWLDAVTDLPSGAAGDEAWSRSEWVEATLPTWRRLAEPVAVAVADAVAAAMADQAPEEMRAFIAGAGAVMRSVGGAVFGMQLGQAVGGLAREVVSATDVGLPLTDGSVLALVPASTAAFAEGLEVPLAEVRLFLAAREAAHARLFAHVPWLRAHLLGAVEAYARGITIDTGRIEEAVRSVDPTDPQALQSALSSGLFDLQRTPAQQAALDRLETALALVEGWVDELVDAAVRRQLPQAGALREAVRRRRAAGGPAEHVLASLVGLELRPRRLRDAARLWAVLEQGRGAAGRDAVWAHPDLLPTAADLDDPEGFARRRTDAEASSADVDAALERLLEEDGGPGEQR